MSNQCPLVNLQKAEEPKIQEKASFKDVLLFLGRKKRTIAVFALVCFALSILVVYFQNHFESQSSVQLQTAFQVYFEGIDTGLTPEGAAYDVSEIKNAEVLQNAISDIQSPVSITVLANALSVQSVLSDADYARETMLSGITSEELMLQMLDEAVFHPDIYIVTLSLSGTGLSEEEGRILLDAVIKEYRSWLIKRYYGEATLGNLFSGGFSIDDYDYIQVADIISQQLANTRSFVENNLTDANFLSAQNGSSRSSLLATIRSLNDNELEQIYTKIATQYITKDVVKAVAIYDNLVEQKRQVASKNNEQAALLLSMIQNYTANGKNSMTIIGDGNIGELNLTTQNAQYDKMVSEYITAVTEAGAATADANYYANEGNRFASAAQTSDEASGESQEVARMLEQLQEKAVSCTALAQETVAEYRAGDTYQKYMEQLVPAAQYTRAGGISAAVLLLAGIIFGAIIGMLYLLFCVYIGKETLIEVSGEKIKEGDGE